MMGTNQTDQTDQTYQTLVHWKKKTKVPGEKVFTYSKFNVNSYKIQYQEKESR